MIWTKSQWKFYFILNANKNFYLNIPNHVKPANKYKKRKENESLRSLYVWRHKTVITARRKKCIVDFISVFFKITIAHITHISRLDTITPVNILCIFLSAYQTHNLNILQKSCVCQCFFGFAFQKLIISTNLISQKQNQSENW
jgi:hypothetical protein